MSIYHTCPIERTISLIKKGGRASGKVLRNIKLNEEQMSLVGGNHPLEYCYIKAHGIERSPTCIKCGSTVTLWTVFKGFRKFCSVTCAAAHNNPEKNSRIGKEKKEKLALEYRDVIKVAAEEYCSRSDVTVKEVELKYNIKGGRLRIYLRSLGLIHKKTKNRNFLAKSDKRLFSKEFFEEKIKSGNTLKYVAKELGVAANTIRLYALKHDLLFPGSSSLGELEIKDFIEGLGFEVSFHERSRLIREESRRKSMEIDIFVPEKNLGIEYNGSYWHAKRSREYHLEKQVLAETHGVDLIQVTDYEWADSREIIESIIRSRLGASPTSIGSRSCEVRNISVAEANEFFRSNHLQGPCTARKAYGLVHEDKLVACMSFGKPRFNKAYDHEMIRFACKLNTSLPGGFHRLLKKFKSENEGSIISYANRRLFSGKIYLSAGFKELNPTVPGYVWTNGDSIVSRYKAQKKKLVGIIGQKARDMTETEIMEALGFMKLWDCGQRVFTLE